MGENPKSFEILPYTFYLRFLVRQQLKRNWSTYSLIHFVKRNNLTSKRIEKLVYMHSSLWIRSRKLPEYLEGPVARWDVDIEDASKIDDDEDNPSPDAGLVGIPFGSIAVYLDIDDGDDEIGVPSEAQGYMDNLHAEDFTLWSSSTLVFNVMFWPLSIFGPRIILPLWAFAIFFTMFYIGHDSNMNINMISLILTMFHQFKSAPWIIYIFKFSVFNLILIQWIKIWNWF